MLNSYKNTLVLDSLSTVGTIITKAPDQKNLTITIKGRPAHAGHSAEAGISTIVVASDAISTIKLPH